MNIFKIGKVFDIPRFLPR